MRRIGVVVIALLAIACSSTPFPTAPPASPAASVIASVATPAPAATPSSAAAPGGTLYVENRWGPNLSVKIGGNPVATVTCGANLAVEAGDSGVPNLPWDLSFVRSGDGAMLWSGEVTSLPRWAVQLGDGQLGVYDSAVLGGTTPPCLSPVTGSDLAPPPPPDIQQALAGAHVTFTPLTDAQASLVTVTAGGAAQAALEQEDYGGNHVKWTKIGCEFLGFYVDQPLHDETPFGRPAYLVETLGDPVRGLLSANIANAFFDAITADRIEGYDAPGSPKGLLGTTCGVEP